MAAIFTAVVSIFVKGLSAEVPAPYITFARFFVGFLYVFIGQKLGKIEKTVNNRKNLLIFGVFGASAATFFFLAISADMVGRATLLNSLQPVFSAIFAMLLFKEKTPKLVWVFAILSFFGVYLVTSPSLSNINIGIIYGLITGVMAGLAVMYMNIARRTETTSITFFYFCKAGMVFSLIMCLKTTTLPPASTLLYLLIMGIFSTIAQLLATYAYKYTSATEGGIVFMSQIFFAMLLGYVVFGEMLSSKGIVGAILILVSGGLVTWLRRNPCK
jgi:drug/metabolite transporter (DMT)-like permease